MDRRKLLAILFSLELDGSPILLSMLGQSLVVVLSCLQEFGLDVLQLLAELGVCAPQRVALFLLLGDRVPLLLTLRSLRE